MQKSIIVILIAGAASLLFAAAASAYTLDRIAVESWTGVGENVVLVVVDFWENNGTADSFAFGYRFSADFLTGEDVLDALHAADNGFTYAQSGGFLTDIWYDTGTLIYHTAYAWPDSWWGYCTSDDFGETWAPSMIGFTERILHDGDCDGWVAADGNNWTPLPTTPVVPEPPAFAVVLGGLTAASGSALRKILRS